MYRIPRKHLYDPIHHAHFHLQLQRLDYSLPSLRSSNPLEFNLNLLETALHHSSPLPPTVSIALHYASLLLALERKPSLEN